MNAVPAFSGFASEVVALREGSRVLVRPIGPADVSAMRRLHGRLSPASVYHRFMAPCPRPSQRSLHYLADVDHSVRDALVALDRGEIVGVARYHGLTDGDAEIAIVVEDAWQRRGLARELLTRLTLLARERGFEAFTGTILGENVAATSMLHSLFPNVRHQLTRGELVFRIPINESSLR